MAGKSAGRPQEVREVDPEDVHMDLQRSNVLRRNSGGVRKRAEAGGVKREGEEGGLHHHFRL